MNMTETMVSFVAWKNLLWAALDESQEANAAYDKAFANIETAPQVLASLKMSQLDKRDTSRLLDRVVDAMREYIDKEYGPFA